MLGSLLGTIQRQTNTSVGDLFDMRQGIQAKTYVFETHPKWDEEDARAAVPTFFNLNTALTQESLL